MSNLSITTRLIQELSNNSGSVVPIAAKDTLSNCAITYIYDKQASKEDGKERAIEEFGTEILWIGGIPLLKKLFDKTVYKFFKADPKFDIRNLKENSQGKLDRLEFLAKNAKDASQKQILENILNNPNLQRLYKKLHVAKFIVATAATLGGLSALIVYKQKTTQKELENKYKQRLLFENELKNDLSQQKIFSKFLESKKDVSFSGNAAKFLTDFMYNPVKNMSILDAGITATRLKMGRKGERFEIGFKEAFQILFIYGLAKPIEKGLEKISKKIFKKPIANEFQLLSNEKLADLIKSPDLKDSIQTFMSKKGDDALQYIFNLDNALIKMLKISGDIPTIKGSDGIIDSFAHIDLENVKNAAGNILELLDACKGKPDANKFLKQVKNYKAAAIVLNILIGAAAIGIAQPMVNIILRKKKNNGQTANPAFKNIEQEMAQKFAFKG